MGVWSIDFITGQYQPEDYTETQVTDFEEMKNFGAVTALHPSGWPPRECTISFVVDGLCDPPGGAVDPEDVYKRLIEACRGNPVKFPPRQVTVSIPGWPGGKAFITKLSIKRTHIDKTGRALRATISVTIKEAPGVQIGGAAGGSGGIGTTPPGGFNKPSFLTPAEAHTAVFGSGV